ncbi:hypothetical protein COO91_06051 [Nostoc flagelliforme CCNUN1]|uniref:Uncharacterized protein n=1 Tax=Nostoc flagelliforme CCNUN1 TaxID=2038116 RepID=A0A2K8SHG7_9NOSO|nr:hypothetical protein COO91_00697 [Nostoc flagelliforme CCNUN1]AUB40054.1 hypothetical protein COO91_06051 [Nostoc flagelliforme CCNUN1]
MECNQYRHYFTQTQTSSPNPSADSMYQQLFVPLAFKRLTEIIYMAK